MSTRTRNTRRRGFTLLELMISISVLAIITVIVYGAFASVTSGTELARAAAQELRFRQFLADNLRKNLVSVYSDSGYELAAYQFLGEEDSGPYGPADRLSFVTSDPLPGANALPGQMKVAQYVPTEGDAREDAAEADLDDMPAEDLAGLMLEITQSPLELGNLWEEVEDNQVSASQGEQDLSQAAVVRRVPILSFDASYYDAEAEEWVEEWDSLERQLLPWAVRVRINFARSEEALRNSNARDLEENPDLEVTVVLPAGAGVEEPFLDLNHRGGVSIMDDPDGIFSETR